MKNRIFAILCLLALFTCFTLQYVEASVDVAALAEDAGAGGSSTGSTGTDLLDNAISAAKDFLTKGQGGDTTLGTNLSNTIINTILPIIKLVGNTVIVIVTVILGVKYIFAGVQGKSTIKETMPTFLLGVLFFYLADELVNFFSNIGVSIQNETSVNTILGNTWSTISVIIQTLAIAGLVFVGLKYMWSPAEKKANIKSQAIVVVLGLMLVYSAVPILTFVTSVGGDLLNGSGGSTSIISGGGGSSGGGSSSGGSSGNGTNSGDSDSSNTTSKWSSSIDTSNLDASDANTVKEAVSNWSSDTEQGRADVVQKALGLVNSGTGYEAYPEPSYVGSSNPKNLNSVEYAVWAYTQSGHSDVPLSSIATVFKNNFSETSSSNIKPGDVVVKGETAKIYIGKNSSGEDVWSQMTKDGPSIQTGTIDSGSKVYTYKSW